MDRDRAAIDDCDVVVALLDGAQVDDGTAWEIGNAYATGKPIIGVRTDFRNAGDTHHGKGQGLCWRLETLNRNGTMKATIIGQSSDLPEEHVQPLYLSLVQAGFPSPAEEYMDGPLDLHEHLVRHKSATFFLRACGMSMINAGIHDGDLLVVDRIIPAGHNKVVIAALDGELTVKRLVRRNGRVLLVPENPDYPEIDITEHEYVHIWGVVTYVIHKL